MNTFPQPFWPWRSTFRSSTRSMRHIWNAGWSLPNPPFTSCGTTWHTYEYFSEIYGGPSRELSMHIIDINWLFTYDYVRTNIHQSKGNDWEKNTISPQQVAPVTLGLPAGPTKTWSSCVLDQSEFLVTDKNHQMWVFSAWSRRGSRGVGGGIIFRSLRTLRQFIGHSHIYIYIYKI